MKTLIPMLALVGLLPLQAQLLAPNDAGVSVGSWHTIVKDVETTKKFWAMLGGTPMKIGGTDVMKFPGVFIFMTKGTPSGTNKGAGLDHPGFNVRNGEELKAKATAAGIKVEPNALGYNLYSPDDLRIEILPDNDRRHPEMVWNKVITGATVPDHLHYALLEASVPEAQAWYGKVLGAKPYSDTASNPAFAIGAALVPGAELKFGKSTTAPGPTKGRTFDRIGFEVKNLKAYCKKLEAGGIKLDQPYSKSRYKGFASAELTDPWGTSIILTEGLNRL